MRMVHRFAYVTAFAVCVGYLLSTPGIASTQETFMWKTDDDGGWLGVSIQDLTTALKEALDYDRDVGVLVNDVEDDSPADGAGIREGDIIIEYDGRDISNTGSLIRKVRATDPGDEVEIVLVRKGQVMTVTATIDEKPKGLESWFEHGKKGKPSILKVQEDRGGWLGVHLQNLTDQLGEYFGVSDGEGVLVTEVVKDSPAEKADLQAGDVIVSYDGDDIDDVDELVEAVFESEIGEVVEIEVMRNKKRRTIRAEISETPKKYRKSPMNFFGLPHMGRPSYDDYLKHWEYFDREEEPEDTIWRHRFHGNLDEDEIEELQKRIRKLEREIERMKDRL